MPKATKHTNAKTPVPPDSPTRSETLPPTSATERASGSRVLRSATALSKAQRTEALIVEAAIDLFSEQGFEETTMRQIAGRAGVSVGNSYYYFASKEALVQAIYERFSSETFAEAMSRMDDVELLADRVATAMVAWIETMRPYKRFGAAFFRSAADFGSPVSPFSKESAGVRDQSLLVWNKVLDEATDFDRFRSIDPRSAELLPQVMWLYALGIVAAWSQDPSPTSERTSRLIHRSAPLLAQVIKLSGTPLFEPVAREVLGLMEEISSLRDPVSPDA